MTAAAPQTVRLLDVDPDLAERLPIGARAEALRLTRTLVLTLRRGELRVEELNGAHASLRGLLLLEGLLARTVRVRETLSLQLLGHGDLVEVAGDPLGGQLVPMETTWTVLEPVRAAVIDDDVLHGVMRWPALAAALFERATAQSARAAARCAISQQPRVEDRVETLLWFLAERFGRIGRDGVVVPLRLTHETIGQMIGAKRPTVSLALKTLERDDVVQRRGDGSWLLRRPAAPLPALEERPQGGIRWAARRVERAPDAAAGLWVEPADAALAAELTLRIERERDEQAAREIVGRVDRARHIHHSTGVRVAAALRNSAITRERSAALRQRLRRARAAARAAARSRGR